MKKNSLPLVSVIIPTLNEEARLGLLLEDLKNQTLQADEVLIIDGNSTDATRTIALSTPKLPVKVLSNPQKRVPHALNIGLEASKGDIIIRIDAHARINDRYIELIASHFRVRPELGGVGGVKIAEAETKTGAIIANVLASPAAVGGSAYHYATETTFVDHIPFGAYTRATLKEVGGWDEKIAVNQDYELDYRIRSTGRRLLLDPAAVITWHSRESVKQLFHQYHRYGQGKAAVVRKHPRSAKPRHLLPTALVIVLLASLVAAVVGPWPYVGLLPLLYAATTFGLASRMWLHGFREHAIGAQAIMAMHIGYGSGFLRQIFLSLFMRETTISGSQTSDISSQ